MKKHILAAAVAAALGSGAYAQNLTIGGTLDAGLQSFDAKGAKFSTFGSNGSATSVVQFRGSEDLGGGLRATFQWELGVNPTETSSRTAGTPATGTTGNQTGFLGNGNTWVGLAGQFGEIRVGTPNSTTLLVNGDGNGGFATSIGSGYRVSSFDAVRFQNSVRYDSPSFNGLAFSVLYVPKNDRQSNANSTGFQGNLTNQTQGRDQISEFGVSFAQGPFNARAASLRMDQFARTWTATAGDPFVAIVPAALTNPGANFRLDSATVGYQVMPVMKVNYFYQRAVSDNISTSGTAITDTKFDRETHGVSASYTMGAATFRVNYQEVRRGSQETTSPSTRTEVTGVGADYALSKRTNLYLRHESNDDKAGLRPTTGLLTISGNQQYRATGLGIRHAF